ncbi:hypothetical protein THOB06_30131 [Vibrio rotiferianus]|nr:hypothetical protein THOG10_30131 [Vibrio rotiferianus]CAH1582562.1 hypothetical protein THOB06_30131 [Vibrio rotiferianus]
MNSKKSTCEIVPLFWLNADIDTQASRGYLGELLFELLIST